MKLRPLLPLIAIAVFGGVPAATAVTADPFGPVEVADPVYRPATNYNGSPPFVGSDGSGNVLLGTIFRDARSDQQLAVHERCGTGPVTWQRTVLSNTVGGVDPVTVQVAADGTAMAVWKRRASGITTHFSVVRPPGGTWGAPQAIVADADVAFMRLALGDNGDAIAVWTDTSATVGTHTAVRPAGGTWGAPELMTGVVSNAYAVAMSPTGQAVVVYKGSTPGYGFSRYRPVGGPWTGEVEVLRGTVQNAMRSVQVTFDGTGRTVALADFDQAGDTIGWNVGTAGAWGPADRTFNDDGDPPEPQYGTRLLDSVVRHPAGAAATWSRKPFDQSTSREVVVARFNGTTWDLKVFQPAAGALSTPRLAVNTAGEILLATDVFQGNVDEIHASIAPSLTAAWPALTRVSPLASATEQYRDPFVTAGGPAFAIGWGVHGGSDDLTHVISTKPAGATCAGPPPPVPTPVPTATATPSATPGPNPPASPNPTPAPSASPSPPKPSAIADFTTLPAASKCVRGRKLTVRFKPPPQGYVAKSVAIKVNAKKVATLKGKALQKPFFLRKLPKRAFTVTVTVTLTTGKGLTERRRYRPCR